MINPHHLPGSQSPFSTRHAALAPRSRRGRVVSFNSATWKAVVQLDGALSAVNMKVGAWVSAETMLVSATVAVLLFADSNILDGVVLGPYNEPALGVYSYRDSVSRTFLHMGA
jgi:hypothetical protein